MRARMQHRPNGHARKYVCLGAYANVGQHLGDNTPLVTDVHARQCSAKPGGKLAAG